MSDRPNRRNRGAGPTRTQADLADVVELLLDKGIVINADIAVSIGDAELLGIQLRAAIASFETAAKYGLEFPTGTDTDRIEEIAGVNSIDADDGNDGDDSDDGDDEETENLELRRSAVGSQFMGLHEPPISEHSPAMKSAPITEPDDSDEESESTDDEGDEGGLSGAIDQAGDVVSGDDGGSSSEPGVRTRPTAPDTDTDADADTSGDDTGDGEDAEDADNGTADGNTADEDATSNGNSETDNDTTEDDTSEGSEE